MPKQGPNPTRFSSLAQHPSICEGSLPALANAGQLALDPALGTTKLLGDLAILVAQEAQEGKSSQFVVELGKQFLAMQVKIGRGRAGQSIEARALVGAGEGRFI